MKSKNGSAFTESSAANAIIHPEWMTNGSGVNIDHREQKTRPRSKLNDQFVPQTKAGLLRKFLADSTKARLGSWSAEGALHGKGNQARSLKASSIPTAVIEEVASKRNSTISTKSSENGVQYAQASFSHETSDSEAYEQLTGEIGQLQPMQTNASGDHTLESSENPQLGRSFTLDSLSVQWGRTFTIDSLVFPGTFNEKIKRIKDKINAWNLPVRPCGISNCLLLSLLCLLVFFILVAGAVASVFFFVVQPMKTRAAPSPPPSTVSYSPFLVPVGPNVALSDLCSGPCCSSLQPVLYQGQAVMRSTWWANRMPHNAQVQFYVPSTRTWLGLERAFQNLSVLSASLNSSPGPTVTFTVDRNPGGGYIQLWAQNGKLLALQTSNSTAASPLSKSQTSSISLLVAQDAPGSGSTLFHLTQVNSSWVYLSTASGRNVTLIPGSHALGVTAKESPGLLLRVRESMGVPAMRGVNLGGWLVAEEWIYPNLFADNVPSLVDGTQLTLQALASPWVAANGSQVYLNSSEGSALTLHMRRTRSPWEMFVALREGSGSYLAVSGARRLQPVLSSSYQSNQSEFRLWLQEPVPPLNGSTDVSVLHPVKCLIEWGTSGRMLSVGTSGTLSLTSAIASGALAAAASNPGAVIWNSPACFVLTVVGELRGQWQLDDSLGSNGSSTLTEHWGNAITLEDFRWITQVAGLNAVRIPVGYWLTQGDSPDAPFVPGGVDFLDQAMGWAVLYNVSVVFSLHGVPGSQNGYEHSGSRDGIAEFYESPDNATHFQQAIEAIEFLAQRYANSTSFFGIGLLNEPTSWGISDLAALQTFYESGFAAVRNYSQCAFVAINPRIDQNSSEMDGFMTDLDHNNVWLDLHNYATFNDNLFGNQSVGSIVNYTQNERVAEINHAEQGERQVAVGEWSLALPTSVSATSEDISLFAQAQLAAYGQSSAGWFFWALKLGREDYPNWSFQQSVELKWLSKSTSFW